MMRKFNTIEEIIEDLSRGKMVIMVDDAERENEGDLVMSADFISPKDINFMATHGRGLICAPMEASRLDDLGLHPCLTRRKILIKQPGQYQLMHAMM